MSLTDPGSFYEVRQKLTSILKVYPDFVKLEVLNEPFDYHRYDYDPKSYDFPIARRVESRKTQQK